MNNIIIYNGITFGNSLAICMSYLKYNSVFWACIHGMIGWIYVVYSTL